MRAPVYLVVSAMTTFSKPPSICFCHAREYMQCLMLYCSAHVMRQDCQSAVNLSTLKTCSRGFMQLGSCCDQSTSACAEKMMLGMECKPGFLACAASAEWCFNQSRLHMALCSAVSVASWRDLFPQTVVP